MVFNETEFLQKARKAFKDARDASDANRTEEVDDLNFLNGSQWPTVIQNDREADGRPCITVNKLPAFVDQVEGEQRQNRPAIKVLPVDGIADPDTAEVLTGHIRNIEQTSQADVAYDTAFSSAVSCGEGYFRVVTEYSGDDIFEQDIRIKRIANPFTVYYVGIFQEIDGSDADGVFVTEWITRENFEKKWPNQTPIDFDQATKDTKDWVMKDKVRVAEYFTKEPITKTIWKVADGQVTDSTVLTDDGEKLTRERLEADGVEILEERTVKTHKIVWYKISGDGILEGPQDWPGRYFPIIPVWGKELNIEGKRIIRGVVRHAKDPQRLYNYSRSHNAETGALAPKAPFILTAEQLGPHGPAWNEAHKRNFPYLLYKHVLNVPPPQRQGPGQLNVADVNEIQMADQELHDTTGLQGASMGERTNEKSGVAVRERKIQGTISTFAYIDNLARGLRYAGKVLIDLIPKIYDTERTIRLLGEDGSVSSVLINAQTKDLKTGKDRIYDVTTGKYDVTVTVGPNYSTQREEAADNMIEFLKVNPAAAPLIGDLIAKNMDWPGAQEISERLRKLLPPGMAEQEPGGEPPLEGVQEGPQGGPPPEAALQETLGEAELETAQVKLDQEKAKLDQEKAKFQGLKLDNQLTQAKIANERKAIRETKKAD